MTGRVITVFVGTDHHPFTRLVDWADGWQLAHPQDVVTVQYGYSAPPRVARGFDCLSWQDLRASVRGSDIVITHGGPGMMMDVRSEGHTPIVLGRDPNRGEHVDNHQQLFVEWAAAKGLGRLVHHAEAIAMHIDALGVRGTRDEISSRSCTEETAHRVAELVRDLLASPAEQRSGHRSRRTALAPRPRGTVLRAVPTQRRPATPEVGEAHDKPRSSSA